MKVFAHRGYSAKYPENTLEAFKKAFEIGSDGIELDVRYTKDKLIVVSHDEDLNRIFGIDKKIADVDFCELQHLTFEKRIPRLEEVLDIIPDDKWVIVEFKEEEPAIHSIYRVLPRKMEDRVIFSSFNHDLITRLIKDFPHLNFAYILGEEHKSLDFNSLIEMFLLRRPHSVHIPLDAYKIFGEDVVKLAKFLRENGIEIFVWNINDPKDLDILGGEYDAVITDEVEKFLEFRNM